MATESLEAEVSKDLSNLSVEHATRKVPSDVGSGADIITSITDPLVRGGKLNSLSEISRVEHLEEVKKQRALWANPNRAISRFDKPNGEPPFEYDRLVEDLRRTQVNVSRIRDAIEGEEDSLERLENQETVLPGTAMAMRSSVANLALFRREIERQEEYAQELQWWLNVHVEWRRSDGIAT